MQVNTQDEGNGAIEEDNRDKEEAPQGQCLPALMTKVRGVNRGGHSARSTSEFNHNYYIANI